MSKHFYLLIFIISLNSFGQNTKLDSLIQATEEMKDDTLKVSKFSKIGSQFINDKSDHLSARKYFEKSLYLADKINYAKGVFNAYQQIGNSYGNLELHTDSKVYFKKAITFFEANPKLIEDKSVVSNYVKCYSNMASASVYMADFVTAQKDAFQSLEMAQKYGIGSGYGWNVLSDIFSRQKNSEEAKKYAMKALGYFQNQNSTIDIARIYNKLGVISNNEKEYEKAIEYYKLCYENNKKINRIYGMRAALSNISNNYSVLKDYEKAINYLNESLKFIDVKDAYSMAATNESLSSLNRQKANFSESLKFGKIALNFSIKSKEPLGIKSSYENLYQTYKASNDSANALIMLEKLSQIKDSLYTSDMAKNTADLAKKYETEKKEQQIVFLDKENKLNQEKLAKEIQLALALKHENELKASKLKQGSLLRNALEKQNDLLDIEIAQKREIQKGLERENALKNSELSTETKLNQTLKLQNNLMAENSKNETLARWLMLVALLGFTAFGINYYRNYTRQKSDNQQIIKQSEELKTLMREVHHRVKNNLQIISAMLRMQARSVADKSAIEALVNSENRLQTIAMVHEKLYKSENLNGVLLKDYLQELMEVLSKQHQNIVPKFHFDIQDNAHLTTNLDTAIPVGLIVNELVTNSFKYAFKELQNGEINLLIGKGNNNDYQLDIRDNGPGFPDGKLPKSSKSLGLKLVTLFTEQLNGSMKYQTDKGSHFTFIFKPISLVS